jgi:hypothetical protein
MSSLASAEFKMGEVLLMTLLVKSASTEADMKQYVCRAELDLHEAGHLIGGKR